MSCYPSVLHAAIETVDLVGDERPLRFWRNVAPRQLERIFSSISTAARTVSTLEERHSNSDTPCRDAMGTRSNLPSDFKPGAFAGCKLGGRLGAHLQTFFNWNTDLGPTF